uniref:trypsin n=1 Tax=Knipowitschia caucasica TaxID=637954 RepID=A0AAV2KNY6_KNICA
MSACGQAALSPRIVGGQEASPGSWPWMVAMYVNFEFRCGGALINDQWVLTAAHCIFPYFYPPSVPEAFRENFTIQVFLGRHNFSDPNPNQKQREVAQMILHPQYNNDDVSHDMALLKLHQPVSFRYQHSLSTGPQAAFLCRSFFYYKV